MTSTFLTSLDIHKVRHLHDISVPLSQNERKNLILTGKNGSGKTSVLESIVAHLKYIVSHDFSSKEKITETITYLKKQIIACPNTEEEKQKKAENARQLAYFEKRLLKWTEGSTANYTSVADLREKYQKGQFILAYYSDTRKIEVTQYKNIEKVELLSTYQIQDRPSKDLGKYLVNLKSTQAFAQTAGNNERAEQIEAWFIRFEDILRMIYHDDSLKLDFNIETFQFSILINGREPFSFNTMSMGYAAVFDIISDLIMRMESQKSYDLEGIVLIDEIETHLHVELQKDIMLILSKLFPNIQFILTTHSPFILNSTPNAVVYDLENETLVKNGMTDLPYEGIIEGYFEADLLSQELREKFEEYKSLIQSPTLDNSDYARIAELEYYLDEIPDYLAINFAEEYTRLKTEFKARD